jgi:hypothetical protein
MEFQVAKRYQGWVVFRFEGGGEVPELSERLKKRKRKLQLKRQGKLNQEINSNKLTDAMKSMQSVLCSIVVEMLRAESKTDRQGWSKCAFRLGQQPKKASRQHP